MWIQDSDPDLEERKSNMFVELWKFLNYHEMEHLMLIYDFYILILFLQHIFKILWNSEKRGSKKARPEEVVEELMTHASSSYR